MTLNCAGARWGNCVRLPRPLAQIPLLANELVRLRDVYRINELVRLAKGWQQATAPKCVLFSHPWQALGRRDKVEKDQRKRG